MLITRSSKPNIVFIHAESMDGRKMSPAGHAATRKATPNLQSLAESGVLFSQAYTTCPVCNPSRASMWTGQYPHAYDCWNNHEGITPDTPTLLDALGEAGYRTHALGPLDYLHGMHSIRDRIGSWTRAAGVMRPISRTPLPVVRDDIDFFRRDREWTDEAVEVIRHGGDDDRPFFLYLTTGLVHPAFQAHTRHMALIDEAAIEVPPTLGDLEETEHPVIRYMRTTKHCENRFSDSLVRRIRHIYYAMIAALDELVGNVMDGLEAARALENTYVVFSSDHGEMAGEQNQILKRSMFEPSVHVPFIVRGPDVPPGERCDTPVSMIDLYPTFLELAGGETGSPAPVGESLVPAITTGAARERDWAFSEYHGDRCRTGTYMIRRGPWKYIRYEGFDGVLYDVKEDPWETRDLASERSDVAADLDRLLTSRFDCPGIDERAKAYDRASFLEWREKARAGDTYEETMAEVYSGFDRQCIEDMLPWREEDEAKIVEWLGEG